MTDILLVEDNPADAALLMELMTASGNNYSIDWVTDGCLALDYLAAKSAPRLILLDLGLPRVNGYEVLEQLRKVLKNNIPVIVLSTSSNPMDTSQCRNLGANDYISKPHDLEGYEELVKRLAQQELPKYKNN